MPHTNPKNHTWNNPNKPTLKNCNLPKERLTKRNVRLECENIYRKKFDYILRTASPTGRMKEYPVTNIHFYNRIDNEANIVVSSMKGYLYTEQYNEIDVLIVPVDEIAMVNDMNSQKAIDNKAFAIKSKPSEKSPITVELYFPMDMFNIRRTEIRDYGKNGTYEIYNGSRGIFMTKECTL